MTPDVQLTDEVISLSRLEFGKFCVVPNGPVEKDGGIAEHRVLGKSDDFPPTLSGVCNPSSIRLIGSEGEVTPTECPHITALVPFVTPENGIYPIFCRLRHRAEDAEGGAERKYKLARYLVPRVSRADPLLLFYAMKEPLNGLSRSQAANISATVVPATRYVHAEISRQFVRQALMYVLSGIPLSFSGAHSEQEFFECVTALWYALPPFLRPLLSAGWGVGSSLSGKMTVTFSESRSPTCATFLSEEGSWSPPSKLMTWVDENTRVLTDYYEERRQLGEYFWKVAYEDTPDHGTRLSFFEQATRARGLSWMDEPPRLELESIPDWHSNKLIRVFRTPGLRARDHLMVIGLRDWLQNGSANLGKLQTPNLDELTYKKNREIAFGEILDAFGDPLQRQRGELSLWESLRKPSAIFSALLVENDRPGRLRALLIEAVRRNDVSRTLYFLFQATRHDDVEPFLSDVESALETVLDQSLEVTNLELLRQHSNLIGLAELPPPYRRWISRNGLKLLSLLLTELGGVEPTAQESLTRLPNGRAMQSILNLNACLRTAAGDIAIVNLLSTVEKHAFISVLRTCWLRSEGEVAERRERLHEWIELLKPEDSGIPLWRLALNEPVVDPQHFQLIATEVERNCVPASLHESVAVLVLQNWPWFGARATGNSELWQVITRRFPAPLEKILFRRTQVHTRTVSREIADAANMCYPTPHELNGLIEFWQSFQGFSQVAPSLWQWAAVDRGLNPATGVVRLVSSLSRLKWPSVNNSDVSRKERNSFIRLADSAKQTDFFYQNHQELWNETILGWQLMVLLRLVRKADFKPTTRQLNSLIPFRNELREHLERRGVHPKQRQNFDLPTLRFQSLDYERDRHLWHSEYSDNNLWALFRRLPIRNQRANSLVTALRAFGEQTEREAKIEERARMCLAYFEAYGATPDFEDALSKLMIEGLVPLLVKSGWGANEIEQMLEMEYQASHSRTGFISLLHRQNRNYRQVQISPPTLQQLLETVVSSYRSSRSLRYDFNRSFQRIQ